MAEGQKNQNNSVIQAMFEAGAHFGYSRSKRHPSMAEMIFGVKNRVEIFDLEKTKTRLAEALQLIENVAASEKKVLFVSGKYEARASMIENADAAGMPYVADRWLGGTLTNWSQMKTRIARMLDLEAKKASGELVGKYTKKEQLMFDREISKLEKMFGGISTIKELPGALFVVDPKAEKTAVSEAKKVRVPVVALMSSDCDLYGVQYPIPANDSSTSSIKFFTEAVAGAVKAGKMRMVAPAEKTGNEDVKR